MQRLYCDGSKKAGSANGSLKDLHSDGVTSIVYFPNGDTKQTMEDGTVVSHLRKGILDSSHGMPKLRISFILSARFTNMQPTPGQK